ncbi:MAG: hypothetical protein Kow00133_15170 [Amphiplicatus sp.]
MPDRDDKAESLRKIAAEQARIADRIAALEGRLDDLAARLQRIGEAVARVKLVADNIRAEQKAQREESGGA